MRHATASAKRPTDPPREQRATQAGRQNPTRNSHVEGIHDAVSFPVSERPIGFVSASQFQHKTVPAVEFAKIIQPLAEEIGCFGLSAVQECGIAEAVVDLLIELLRR